MLFRHSLHASLALCIISHSTHQMSPHPVKRLSCKIMPCSVKTCALACITLSPHEKCKTLGAPLMRLATSGRELEVSMLSLVMNTALISASLSEELVIKC